MKVDRYYKFYIQIVILFFFLVNSAFAYTNQNQANQHQIQFFESEKEKSVTILNKESEYYEYRNYNKKTGDLIKIHSRMGKFELEMTADKLVLYENGPEIKSYYFIRSKNEEYALVDINQVQAQNYYIGGSNSNTNLCSQATSSLVLKKEASSLIKYMSNDMECSNSTIDKSCKQYCNKFTEISKDPNIEKISKCLGSYTMGKGGNKAQEYMLSSSAINFKCESQKDSYTKAEDKSIILGKNFTESDALSSKITFYHELLHLQNPSLLGCNNSKKNFGIDENEMRKTIEEDINAITECCINENEKCAQNKKIMEQNNKLLKSVGSCSKLNVDKDKFDELSPRLQNKRLLYLNKICSDNVNFNSVNQGNSNPMQNEVTGAGTKAKTAVSSGNFPRGEINPTEVSDQINIKESGINPSHEPTTKPIDKVPEKPIGNSTEHSAAENISTSSYNAIPSKANVTTISRNMVVDAPTSSEYKSTNNVYDKLNAFAKNTKEFTSGLVGVSTSKSDTSRSRNFSVTGRRAERSPDVRLKFEPLEPTKSVWSSIGNLVVSPAFAETNGNDSQKKESLPAAAKTDKITNKSKKSSSGQGNISGVDSPSDFIQNENSKAGQDGGGVNRTSTNSKFDKQRASTANDEASNVIEALTVGDSISAIEFDKAMNSSSANKLIQILKEKGISICNNYGCKEYGAGAGIGSAEPASRTSSQKRKRTTTYVLKNNKYILEPSGPK